MVINAAIPLNSKNQNKKWLLFNRELMNETESDVSDMAFVIRCLFEHISVFFILISLLSFLCP